MTILKTVIVGDDVSIQCTTLHEIGFTSNGDLKLLVYCLISVYSFKKTVYFPILAHKGADFKRMKVVLCYDG